MEIATLYDGGGIPSAPFLTKMLRARYDGDLYFGGSAGRPIVFCNFVQTLDGIISLEIPGKSAGAEISGHNQEDAFIMAVLRACADAVIIG